MSTAGGRPVRCKLPLNLVGAGFAPTEFAPISGQFDRVRPQQDRVAYRDYSSFFYPLPYEIVITQ